MIYLICALYEEAVSFIEGLQLKRNNDIAPFVLYEDQEGAYRLILSGIGLAEAAGAVSYLFAIDPPGPGDFLVNFGTCACSRQSSRPGQVFVCGKITDQASGRDYYPDRLLRLPFKEADLVTLARVLREDPAGDRIYDMEGAGIFQAAARFLGPHQMLFLKAVSDHGDPKALTKAGIRQICLEAYKEISPIIFDLQQAGAGGQARQAADPARQEALLYAPALKCTAAMTEKLSGYLRYFRAAGIDFQAWYEKQCRQGLIPVSGKKEGSLMLAKCRRELVLKEQGSGVRQPEGEGTAADPLVWERPFSHIYIEEEAFSWPLTGQILGQLPGSRVIRIRHYKDVFNRGRQDYALQHRSMPLILAVKRDHYFYPGAPVCQDFGNDQFYYSSSAMNCPFDCAYCYLKGMYPSGCMVLFVNLEDYFREARRILSLQPMYICVSYDTDLPAIESLTGYVKKWSRFVRDWERDADERGKQALTIEIRTKSAGIRWEEMEPCDHVIFAFTLSAPQVIRDWESGTPSLPARLACIREGLERGFPIRLCFDPLLFGPGWREDAGQLIRETAQTIDLARVRDVSVGSFRISGDYLARMRRIKPGSSIISYPFEKVDGYYQYDRELAREMEGFVEEKLSSYMDPERIFRL